MNRLIKLLTTHNICFIPLPTQNSSLCQELLRNIKALGYDSLKIEGEYTEPPESAQFLSVISGTHYKESFRNLSDNMLSVCKKNRTNMIVCFKAGKPKGTIIYTEENKNSEAADYFAEESNLYLNINNRTFTVLSVSDIIDHKIRTASMFNSYKD